MRNIFVIASLAAILATPAYAQSIGERTGVNSMLGLTPKTPDFVKEAAMSDMFEIQSSKIAAEKGNAAVKSFASHMIADHTKVSNEAKAAVSSGKVEGVKVADLPTALDSSHQSKIDKLNGLSGDDFNRNYADMQVDAHKTAVDLFERYSKGGDNADLKSWASTTLPTLRAHYDLAQKLNDNDGRSVTGSGSTSR